VAESRTPTSHRAEPSLGNLVADAHASLSTLIHGEIELAKLEIKSSVRNAGIGAGMFLTAAILLLYALTFALIALALGLVAAGIWSWAAFLIVFGILAVLATLLVLVGVRQIKRVKAPEQTIETTRGAVAALKEATK
jgi:Putative Actinobacterial Holin-X, holin superfamily III